MDNNQTFGYKVGYLIGCIACACTIAVMLALTVKFITWLF